MATFEFSVTSYRSHREDKNLLPLDSRLWISKCVFRSIPFANLLCNLKILKMNNLKYSFLAFILMAFFMTSCTKENIDETNTEKEEVVPKVTTESNALFSRSNEDESTEGWDLGCVIVNFPFSVVDEDGLTYEVTSDADFATLFDTTSVLVIVDFEYPLSITLEAGTVASAADAEELGELFVACVPDGGWDVNYFPAYLIGEDNSCFAVSYPIALEDPSGGIINIENEEDYIAALAEEQLSFVFPFNLVDEEGETFVVDDVDGLFELLISCNEYDFGDDSTGIDWETNFEFLGCYHIEFPIVIELQDGTMVTVENHEEYCDILLQGEMKGYGYPLILTDSEGEVIEVNSVDELEDALSECGFIFVNEDFYTLLSGALPSDSTGVETCYTINFPIGAEYSDFEQGTTEEVIFDDLESILNFNNIVTRLDYPVTIVLVSDGTEVVLESFEDLLTVLEACY